MTNSNELARMSINPSELFARATEQYEYLLSCLTSLDEPILDFGFWILDW